MKRWQEKNKELEFLISEADAQALADVRTLDEWAKANGMGWAVYFGPDTFTSGPGYCVRLGDLPPCATCPTPDAARHAAAEWVRGQR